MALSEIDRNLLERCLARRPRAWEDFVDRFMGLVIHVVNHTVQARSLRLSPEDRDDLCSEVFLSVLEDDFAVLRHFRGQSSLATYLTVIARRIVVKTLQKRRLAAAGEEAANALADPSAEPEERIINREEVERLLDGLEPGEAQVVRMYHLESKSYEEISREIGVSQNSVGPILSRARTKLRRAGANPA